ncbi:MAG: M60 family metallopeptidase [Niabella sp.]
MIKVLNKGKVKNYPIAISAVIGMAVLILASCGKKSDFGYLKDPTKEDNGLDSVVLKVDTSLNTVDKSKYLQAGIFPGLVCAEEPRVTKTIDLDLFYVKSEDLRISVLPSPQFSTGFYAAPGELVIITVPQGVYDLSVQIGAWTDDVGHIQNAQRDAVIYSRAKLVPGKNYVRNLYGGHIYILPSSPRTTPLSLTFENVVESPDFVLGKTDPAEWKQKLAKSCVPYLELRSKYMIFTIRRDYAIRYPIDDPVQLMTEWDQGIKEDFYGWTGLEENPADPLDRSPQLPYRIVLDVNISAGYGHSGFPIMAINDIYWQTTITGLNNLRQSNVWGLYHEIGHNFQQGKYWSWPALGETSNNLFVYHLSKRMRDAGLGTWPAKHENPEQSAAAILAFAAASGAKDFDNFTDPYLSNVGISPFVRLMPFLQMFDKIPANWGYQGQGDGWGIMTELYKRSRRAIRESSTTLAKHDFVYETVSDYTKKDWMIFFKQWGISLSTTAMARVEAKGYPLMLQELWKYNPYTRTGGDNIINLSTYLKSLWTATTDSWATNEGAANGVITAALDNDFNTYWHSRWSTSTTAGTGPTVPPFTITVDMVKSATLHGFSVALRRSGTGVTTVPRTINVEVSTNNVDWTSVVFQASGNNTMTTVNTQALQSFILQNDVSCRYFRFVIPTGNGNGSSAALSELDVVYP